MERVEILEHEADYQRKKMMRQEEMRRYREQSIQDHKDHVNSLPYTPNLRANPED